MSLARKRKTSLFPILRFPFYWPALSFSSRLSPALALPPKYIANSLQPVRKIALESRQLFGKLSTKCIGFVLILQPLDFTLLDRHFGNILEWRAAITEIHRRGLYVIIDNTMST